MHAQKKYNHLNYYHSLILYRHQDTLVYSYAIYYKKLYFEAHFLIRTFIHRYMLMHDLINLLLFFDIHHSEIDT